MSAVRPVLADAINRVCPWSGDPVAADALTDYRGHVVGFCKPARRGRFAGAVAAFDALLKPAGADEGRDG